MGVTQAFRDTLEKFVQSYEIRCYIEDSGTDSRDPEWVDFSDRLETTGKDLLESIGPISHVTEGKAGIGAFYTKVGTIKMSNVPASGRTYDANSGFFDQPFPNTLKTIYGNTAVFEHDDRYQYSVLYRHRLRLALRLYLKDGSVEEGTLGTFLIDGVSTDGEVAYIKVVGLAKKLMEADASRVKRGQSWYTNRPYSFLVRELVKLEFGEGSALPSNFVVPDNIEIQTADGERTLSSFGRPPEWTDTDGDGEGDTWLEKGYICRALCWHNGKLYLGCDEHLYEYDPDTDTYTRLTSATSELGTDFHIRRLWHNPNYPDSGEFLWGVAWPDPALSNRSVAMKIFSYSPSAGVVVKLTESIFPGDFCVRDGRQLSAPLDANYVAGQDEDYVIPPSISINRECGENVAVPFAQRPSFDSTEMDLAQVANRSSLFSKTGDGTLKGLPDQVNAGYYIFVGRAISPYDGRKAGFRFSLGQTGCVVFNPNYVYDSTSGTKRGAILYCAWDGTGYNYAIYDIENDTERTIVSGLQINSVNVQPTCGCADPSTDDFYVGAMAWYDSGTDYSRSYILKMSPPTAAAGASYSILYDSSLYSVKTRTPLEIVYDDMDLTGYPLYVVTFDRAKLSETDAYEIMMASDSVAGDLLTLYNYPTQPRMLTVNTGQNEIYFVLEGSAKLYLYDTSTSPVTQTVCDDGYPVVEGESNVLALAIDPDTRSEAIVYGISSPSYSPETQNVYPNGKYWLWKYDSYYSGRVELADFEGKTAWEALKLLAQASDYVMGFDPEGNFFFVPRPDSGTPDYIFQHNTEWSRIYRIMKDWGYDEIYNYCRVTPYRVQKAEPEATFITVEPAEGTFKDGSGNNMGRPDLIGFSVYQKDGSKKALKLVCVENGDISSSTDYPLFKWLVYESVIEASLAQDITATQTTIYLNSVYGGNDDPDGIHDYDYIVIQKDDGISVIREIRDVDADANTIDIYGVGGALGFGVALEAGTPVQIIKRFRTSGLTTRTRWSDEGVTYVVDGDGSNTTTTFAVASAEHISLKTVIQIEDEKRRVVAIDTSPSGYDKITVDTAFSWAPVSGALVRAYWAPNALDEYFPIGGTNVSVKFLQTSGTADIDYTSKCFKGDVLDITCRGLYLEKDEHSVRSALIPSSVSKYGRREWPGIDDPFLNHKMAEDICKRVVNAYAEPRYIVTIEGIFLPHLNFINSSNQMTLVGLQAPELFPLAYQVVGYPREIVHDPINCKTKVVLRVI